MFWKYDYQQQYRTNIEKAIDSNTREITDNFTITVGL